MGGKGGLERDDPQILHAVSISRDAVSESILLAWGCLVLHAAVCTDCSRPGKAVRRPHCNWFCYLLPVLGVRGRLAEVGEVLAD